MMFLIGGMIVAKHFGEVLRELREIRGLGVNQLALQSGVSSALISKIENKERGKPKPETIEKLAKGLKMKYEELMEKAEYLETKKERDDSALINEISDSVMRELIEKYGADFSDPEAAEMLEQLVKMVAKMQKKEGN
jgi:transcriptional regulator with XRE-family HTH domain